MKSRIFLICTLMAVALAVVGCSQDKVFKDKETGYQMKYDNKWKVEKNVEVAEDYGTLTYNAVFTTTAQTADGEPAASLKVLKEDLSKFEVKGDDTLLDDVAAKLSGRLADGFVSYQNATINGLKGYWMSVQTLGGEEADNKKTDIIFCVSGEDVYEFYYTAVGEENYNTYESDVNYMLYNFSVNE